MKLLTILTLFLIPGTLLADSFVAEKQCKLYENNSAKVRATGKSVENEEYALKEFKEIRNRKYAVILKNKAEYLINEGCGYSKFDEKPLLSDIFDSIEKEKLNTISKFDKKILEVCGYFGSHPSREKLGELLENSDFKTEFDQIYKNLNGTIKTKNAEKHIFLDELLDVLFNKGGFQHTICGTAKNGSITHYYPRLLELEKKRFVGSNKNLKCRENEENENVKNLSLSFIDRNNQIISKCSNSFTKSHTAVDIISIAGNAAKAQEMRDSVQNKYQTCVYNYKNTLFNIVVYEQSLITLYPVVSDKCSQEERKLTKCFCNIENDNSRLANNS